MKSCLFILNMFCGELHLFLTPISFIPLQTIDFPIWIPIQSCLCPFRIFLNPHLDSTPIVDNSIHNVFLPPYPSTYITPYILPYSPFISSFLSYSFDNMVNLKKSISTFEKNCLFSSSNIIIIIILK